MVIPVLFLLGTYYLASKYDNMLTNYILVVDENALSADHGVELANIRLQYIITQNCKELLY